MSLEVSIKHIAPDTAVVSITGPLTLGTGLKIADTQIQSLIESGASKLVLDLAGVPYSDSAGLGVLIHMYGLVQERKGMLRLCTVSDRVAGLVKMTRTNSLLPMDADVDASLAAMP